SSSVDRSGRRRCEAAASGAATGPCLSGWPRSLRRDPGRDGHRLLDRPALRNLPRLPPDRNRRRLRVLRAAAGAARPPAPRAPGCVGRRWAVGQGPSVGIDPIERTNLSLSAGAVAASLALASPGFAASLAVGALLEAWNFRGLRRSAQFLFWGEIRGSRGWLGVYALRMSLLVIGIGAALYFGANPIGLLIGL